ncbi:MAG: hypothetical protein PHS79_00730 [Patescibacteria group bacterium]|nr:hypothetical protein [Patescibacteria group bacterium]
MKTNKSFWMFAIALGVTLVGCTGAKKFGTRGLCTPGDTGDEIACKDGSQGFLLCNKDGDAFNGGDTCKEGQQPATGCGSKDAECAPGEQVSCGCNDGREGAQKCNTACDGFDVCICSGPLPGTGGQGGSGGPSGQGGAIGGSGGSTNTGGTTQTGGNAGSGGSTGGSGGTTSTGGSGGSSGGTGGTSGTGGGSQVCTPQQEYYDCGGECGSLGGSRWCRADGLSYGPCVCNTATGGAGGTSGTGGSGGSTGGAGGNTGGTGGSTGGSGGSTSYCGTASDACLNVVQQPCYCQVDGSSISGTQNCKPDCSGWEACYCNSGAGGSGGSGGTGGSGGSGGTGGTGGSGGVSGTAVDVTCEITHADYTAFKFDFANFVMSSVQHVYSVFVSDEGVDDGHGGATYATATHLKWGDALNLQQLGRSVKFAFRTTLGSRITLNAVRDPIGNDLSSGDYWREPAVDKGVVKMKVDCLLKFDGSDTMNNIMWPHAEQNEQHTGWNLALTVQTAWTTTSDQDGDGSSPPQDCDDHSFYKAPGLVEIIQDGVDNNCYGGDEKYRRVVMDAPSGIMNYGGLMKYWDFNQTSPHGVKMIYDGHWASAYVPVSLLPVDTMSGYSTSQPGGLVEYNGSGDNCYNGLCWNMSDWGGSCHPVYPVWSESYDSTHISSTTARNVNNQCRSFFPATL